MSEEVRGFSARVARCGRVLVGPTRSARQRAAANVGTPSLHQQLRAGPEELAIVDRKGENGGRGFDVSPSTEQGRDVDGRIERQLDLSSQHHLAQFAAADIAYRVGDRAHERAVRGQRCDRRRRHSRPARPACPACPARPIVSLWERTGQEVSSQAGRPGRGGPLGDHGHPLRSIGRPSIEELGHDEQAGRTAVKGEPAECDHTRSWSVHSVVGVDSRQPSPNFDDPQVVLEAAGKCDRKGGSDADQRQLLVGDEDPVLSGQ